MQLPLYPLIRFTSGQQIPVTLTLDPLPYIGGLYFTGYEL